MSKGNLQYLSDTLLLEKVLRIEEGITKQAGLVDSFRNAANAIKEQVANRVKQDGVGITLVNYIAPAVLGRIWPPLGIVATLASLWGVNIGQIMNGMMNSLKSKIESGQLLTMSEINDAGKSVSGSLGGSEDDIFKSEAGDDFLYALRKIETDGKLTSLVREAQYRSWSGAFKAAPNLRGSGGVLGKIFGSVGRGKGKWLLIGIVIWFVKTVLLGAGLVEGTEAAAKAVGVKDKVDEIKTNITTDNKSDEKQDTYHADYIAPAVSIPNTIPHNFKPSGQGQQYHLNDGQSIWIVPLLNGDTADTLISWALSIYPEIQGRENELRSLQPFNNMVSILNSGINPKSPNYLTVPKGLNSRKTVVDKFIGAIPKDNTNAI